MLTCYQVRLFENGTGTIQKDSPSINPFLGYDWDKKCTYEDIIHGRFTLTPSLVGRFIPNRRGTLRPILLDRNLIELEISYIPNGYHYDNGFSLGNHQVKVSSNYEAGHKSLEMGGRLLQLFEQVESDNAPLNILLKIQGKTYSISIDPNFDYGDKILDSTTIDKGDFSRCTPEQIAALHSNALLRQEDISPELQLRIKNTAKYLKK
ncbi:MAG: hypothetical protein ACRCXZ_08095 [Patescibacteria group bacterium]